MIDDHSTCTALGLCAFARIIDDKWIDMRHRAEDRFGIAVFGERQSLSGQPFQIAMLAHMDNGIDRRHFTQIGIKSNIAMRGH